MAKIYVKLLYTERRTWSQVPDDNDLKRDVKTLMKLDVANGVITVERYEEITGEPYVA